MKKCYLGHLRAHSGLSGPLTQGKEVADGAAKFIANASPGLPESLHRAQAAHSFHHLNAHTLRLTFEKAGKRLRGGHVPAPASSTTQQFCPCGSGFRVKNRRDDWDN